MVPVPFPLGRVLLTTTSVVVLLGLGAEIASASGVDSRLVGFFSLSVEGNLPTWYASSLLLACAALLGAMAHSATADRRHWGTLALIFVYLSLDEAAELHENLGGLFGTGGVLYFDWVIPAAVVCLLLAAVFLPFVWRLRRDVRNRIIAAGALYVAGALLLELPLGWWTERAGDDNAVYAFIDLIEESLELAGATLLADTLWKELR